ncbi:MAG: VOC family protein [Kordiimonadaceae bacterium]|nr:VOC family protein [Kordiimonadaceae bacterium]
MIGETALEITLNHTIVPAIDRVVSAKWYEDIFGFEFVKEWGPFAVVKVNSSLVLDFMNTEKGFAHHHYAFKVSDQDFDAIFERIQTQNIRFGSGPFKVSNGKYDDKINHLYGGRGVYFTDPNGHILKIITTDYDLDT